MNNSKNIPYLIDKAKETMTALHIDPKTAGIEVLCIFAKAAQIAEEIAERKEKRAVESKKEMIDLIKHQMLIKGVKSLVYEGEVITIELYS